MSRTIRTPREFHRIVMLNPYGVLVSVEIMLTTRGYEFLAEFKDSTGFYTFDSEHVWTQHALDAAYVRKVSIETYLADRAVGFARRAVQNKWHATVTHNRTMDEQITYRGRIEEQNRMNGMPLHPFAATFSDEYKLNVRLRHDGTEWLR